MTTSQTTTRIKKGVEPDFFVTEGLPYYIESLGLLIIEALYFTEIDGNPEADWDAAIIYEGMVKKILPKKMLRTMHTLNKALVWQRYTTTQE